MEIKNQKKQESINKKKKEMNCEKEIQKRKLEEAINLHKDFVGVADQKKKVQERIINNFRSYNSTSYLQPPPPFASAMPPSRADTSTYLNPQISQHPYYTQGVNGNINNNIIDLTNCANPSRKMEMIPNFISLSNSHDDNNEEREREKSKLMKVCVNHTRSALKKNRANVKLTNDSTSSSTGNSTGHDSDSDN